MRARDDADVDLDDPTRADGLDLALLERAQQLRLDRHRQLADLVEHERAAVGLREEAGALRDRAGERTARVTEQLGVGELGGDRGAVEADERAIAARAARRGSATRSAPCRCRSRRGPAPRRRAARSAAPDRRRVATPARLRRARSRGCARGRRRARPGGADAPRPRARRWRAARRPRTASGDSPTRPP